MHWNGCCSFSEGLPRSLSDICQCERNLTAGQGSQWGVNIELSWAEAGELGSSVRGVLSGAVLGGQ